MPTEQDFRRIALGLADAVESAHMGHPDFRVNGRIFATLHHDRAFGMVKLTPEQQEVFLRDHPAAFAPESGAWGRQGCTRVRLKDTETEVLGEAMTLAWQNAVNQPPPKRAKTKRAPATSAKSTQVRATRAKTPGTSATRRGRRTRSS
jgi:hypothetical protein